MALAVIRGQDALRGYLQFGIDVGKNRYYSYTIGETPLTLPNGLRVLDEPSYASPVTGPLADESLGRGLLRVPAQRFNRKDRYIQLISFRTAQRDGPAFSEILPVIPSLTAEADLTDITLALSREPMQSIALEDNRHSEKSFGMEVYVNVSNIPTVPFRYREPAWSEPMFLEGLISALPNLISSALPALGNILPALFGGGGAPAPGGAPPGSSSTPGTPAAGNSALLGQIIQTISNPETIRAVLDVIKTFKPDSSAAKSLAVSSSYNGGSNGYSHAAEYSRALIAPALLAALPALMPVIEKILNPETLKALNPALLGSEINLKQQQQLFEHLRQIQPQMGTPEMDKLFEGLSLGHVYAVPGHQPIYGRSLSRDGNGKSIPDFKPVDSVELRFAEQNALTLDGRQRLLYRAGQALAFPLSLNTPKPIASAELTFQVKDPASLKVLIEKKVAVNKLSSGRLPEVPRLEAAQVESLTPNEDYLICAHLVWRSKSGRPLGVQRSHLITLVGEYIFDRVETTDETVALNNVEKFRDFWHKVWQDSFTDTIRRRFFDVKYYYTLERERTSNARMETVSQSDKGNGPRDETGRLKAGLITSPFALNELLPVVSSYPSLTKPELSALLASDFATHFRYAARSKVRFTGKNGDSTALWVFPEFRLNRVILKQVAKSDDNGQVQELSEYEVRFPMPSVTHFIGVRTQ